MTACAVRSEYPHRGSWLRLSEPPPEPLSEADLSLVWEGQRFPPEALCTPDGRAVEVINPGRRGGAAGPDFLDAVVLVDGVERRGDIELHVRASAFRAHGHAGDAAYSRLALHVVYRADDGAQTALCGGGSAPVAAFAPWLERRGAELQSWLAAPSMWQEPCRGACGSLGETAVRDALADAGRRRFKARVRSMVEQARLLGAEEALWRALLDVLGVGGDRDGFRRLALAFPASLAAEVKDLGAALAYVAGLDGAAPAAAGLPAPLRPALLASGRPANHPRRRLAGLASLYERAKRRLGNAARQDAGCKPEGEPSAGRAGVLAATALATVAAGSARDALAGWQVKAADGSALIGAERAKELLVNAVLPLAASQGLEPEALAMLQVLPASPAYGKTGFLEANLRPAKGRIARTALEQQGLLGLIAEWCSQGGCGRCPLS
jgi:hypothetical protein